MTRHNRQRAARRCKAKALLLGVWHQCVLDPHMIGDHLAPNGMRWSSRRKAAA